MVYKKKNPILINEISLENFRVFKDKSSFELAPITILTGANSSGKSSVIKALNLMQGFYKEKDNITLNFVENAENSYHHQLGDFDLVLNRENQNKNEFSISYKIPYKFWDEITYNYWGDLFVKNTFEKKAGNDNFKQGKLTSSSIYLQNEKVLLSKIDYQENTRYFNIPEIIKIIQTLHREYIDYKEKIKPYIVMLEDKIAEEDNPIKDETIMTINDYTGPVTCFYNHYSSSAVDFNPFLEGYCPKLDQQFSDFMGFDYVKLQIFASNSNLLEADRTFIKFQTQPIISSCGFSSNVSCIYNPKILKLISQIPIANYDNFEQNLWELIVNNDSRILDKHSLESFLKIFEDIDHYVLKSVWRDPYSYEDYHPVLFPLDNGEASIQAIKDFIKKTDTKDFKSFYDKIISEIHNETSTFEYSDEKITNQIYQKITSKFSLEKYCSTANMISILRYFYMLETILNHHNGSIDYFYFESDGFPIAGIPEWRIQQNPDEKFDNIQVSHLSVFRKSKLYSFIEDAIKSIDFLTYEQIKLFNKKSDFIESVRANTQRLYTYMSQGTSFNNFLVKFLDKKYPIDFIDKWVKEFEIGDGVDYKKNIVAGVGTQLIIKRGDDEINIVDLGYGVTQFLALLLRIVYADENGYSTVAIEEPETNLHPDLQTKLADLFIDAYDTFGINFIIETHSEYLIRKLQVLTATGQIKPEETVIHYIGRNPNEEQVKTIHIKHNGKLTKKFGSGFFDEADMLAICLVEFEKD